MSLLSVLTVVFIVLKLMSVIDWSWFLVLLPTILHIILFVSAFAWLSYMKSKGHKR